MRKGAKSHQLFQLDFRDMEVRQEKEMDQPKETKYPNELT